MAVSSCSLVSVPFCGVSPSGGEGREDGVSESRKGNGGRNAKSVDYMQLLTHSQILQISSLHIHTRDSLTNTRGSSSLAYTYDLPSVPGVGAREPWSGVAEVRVGRFRLRRRLWTSSVRNPSGFLGDGESGTATQKHKTAKIDVSPIIKSCNVYCT